MIKMRLFSLLQKSGIYVLMEIIFQWITLIFQILIIQRFANIIARLFTNQLTSSELIYSALLIAVCILIKALLQGQYLNASYMASVDVKKVIRSEILGKLHRLGSGYSKYIPTSQISQMMGEGVEQLEIYFGKYISQFVYAILAPLTLFMYLYRYSLKAALVLIAMVPLIPMVIMLVMKIAKKVLDKYFQIYYGLGDTFLEKLQGMTTLKIYQADESAAQEMDIESERFRRITMKVLSMQLNSTIIMDVVAYVGTAMGIIITLHEIMDGSLGLYQGLLFLLLSAEFFLPMRMLGAYFHIGMNGMKAADRMFEFLDIAEPKE